MLKNQEPSWKLKGVLYLYGSSHSFIECELRIRNGIDFNIFELWTLNKNRKLIKKLICDFNNLHFDDYINHHKYNLLSEEIFVEIEYFEFESLNVWIVNIRHRLLSDLSNVCKYWIDEIESSQNCIASKWMWNFIKIENSQTMYKCINIRYLISQPSNVTISYAPCPRFMFILYTYEHWLWKFHSNWSIWWKVESYCAMKIENWALWTLHLFSKWRKKKSISNVSAIFDVVYWKYI